MTREQERLLQAMLDAIREKQASQDTSQFGSLHDFVEAVVLLTLKEVVERAGERMRAGEQEQEQETWRMGL